MQRVKRRLPRRFVSNKWVDYQTHYLPYLSKGFLRGLFLITSLDRGIVLVLDGSQEDKNNTLTVS